MELGPCENLFSGSQLSALIMEVTVYLKHTYRVWAIAHLVEFMSSMLVALVQGPALHKLGGVAHSIYLQS